MSSGNQADKDYQKCHAKCTANFIERLDRSDKNFSNYLHFRLNYLHAERDYQHCTKRCNDAKYGSQ